MGTTAQKLQRILETKTGFKNLITEKGGVITETTTFHEYIDEARKLMEGGKVVVEEASATAVPNNGTVEKVYFNTNLTSEEVDKIITDANLPWVDANGMQIYFVISMAGGSGGLSIVKASMFDPSLEGHYSFLSVFNDDTTPMQCYLSTAAYPFADIIIGEEPEKAGYDENGWCTRNGEWNGESFPQADLTSDIDGYPVGTHNEALKQIFSITPFSAGKQPVPNSGYVESIKFNTSLSCEEVDKIIIDANLDLMVAEGYIAYHIAPREYLMIGDFNKLTNGQQSGCMIMHQDNDKNLIPIYLSPNLAEMSGVDFVGWNPDFNGVLIINAELVNSMNFEDTVLTIGYQNDRITDLIYVGTDLFKKELTGNYEAVTVDVTENSEVDLTTYWDNQQMPIKVNVNIEAGASGEAIEIATEEELDAVMVEENIGKFYKYTGETTVKYEKDAVYVVQDADNPIIEDEIKSIATETEMDAVLVEENIGKFFLYAGETCDKYINNMIYTVQDKDNPIIDGPAIIEGGATGTAVPNEGHVDKIYFNTNLTSEEVDKIITDANLEWFEGTAQTSGSPSMNIYFVSNLTSPEYPSSLPILIMDYASMQPIPDGSAAYAIMVAGEVPVYISPSITEDSTGWIQEGFNLLERNGIVIHGEANSTCNLGGVTNNMDAPVGLQNEALKQIISTTPFDGEPFYKELKGTYEPVTVEVTENGEIDLTTYMDNGGMPIKINVNVEGSSDSGVPLQPATEEEMNNLLINENIGKVFLYTGETNENFTNGEYYIIEEVTE